MDDEERRKNIPEEFDGQLDCSSLAICCSFNRRGSLLAVGCNDGRVVIWDFLNRCVAKNIPTHAGQPITSLSWSRRGSKLVTGSLDNSIAIWYVPTGECLMKWTYKAPIMKVQFNRRNENLILICPFRHPALLMEVQEDKEKERKTLIVKRFQPMQVDKDEQHNNIVASLDRRGQYIYTGNSRGRLSIFKCPQSVSEETQFENVSSFKIQQGGANPPAFIEIVFAANKELFLVNTTDRSIRIYNCDMALSAGVDGNCEEIRKFTNSVEKEQYKRCCFSGDKQATFVCGIFASKLKIFCTEDGSNRKNIECSQRENLLDVQWHPTKPIVTSVTGGLVYIWARAEVENWSAYAPQFKELEENQEYSEPESEFDIEDEDKDKQPKKKTRPGRNSRDDNSNDESDVDIMTVDCPKDLASSDEDEYDTDALGYIPVALEDHEMVEQPQ